MKATTIAAVIAMLVPPSAHKHHKETEEQASERYDRIAYAIHDAAWEDDTLQSFILTVGYHESMYRRDVQIGELRGDNGRSWGLFQFHVANNPEAKIPTFPFKVKEVVGLDVLSVWRASYVAAEWLKPLIRSCNARPVCVFCKYGGVNLAKAEDIVKERIFNRARTYKKVRKYAKATERSSESPITLHDGQD